MILPNVIKNDRYNFELYRFKVGAFLRHSAVYVCEVVSPHRSILTNFIGKHWTTTYELLSVESLKLTPHLLLRMPFPSSQS